MENREETIKAIKFSLIAHMALALVIFAVTPSKKPNVEIENVPDRVARLLVEPPKVVLEPPKMETPRNLRKKKSPLSPLSLSLNLRQVRWYESLLKK